MGSLAARRGRLIIEVVAKTATAISVAAVKNFIVLLDNILISLIGGIR
jgi:hypothetical protein